MKCPYCGSENNNTSGFHKKELRRGRVRRWRRCLDCGEKFTTIEFYVPDDIMRHKKENHEKEIKA